MHAMSTSRYTFVQICIIISISVPLILVSIRGGIPPLCMESCGFMHVGHNHINRCSLPTSLFVQAPFLNRVEVIAETGKSQSDILLDLYETKWKRSVDPLYHEYAY